MQYLTPFLFSFSGCKNGFVGKKCDLTSTCKGYKGAGEGLKILSNGVDTAVAAYCKSDGTRTNNHPIHVDSQFLTPNKSCSDEFKLGWSKHPSTFCWYQSKDYQRRTRNKGTTMAGCKAKCKADNNCKAISYSAKFQSDKNICVLCSKISIRNYRAEWTSYVEIPTKGCQQISHPAHPFVADLLPLL